MPVKTFLNITLLRVDLAVTANLRRAG